MNAQISNDCANPTPICRNTPINGGVNGFGIDDFNGVSSTGCLENSTSGFIESNSAWYTFRTGASGQLGFNIGHDSLEDWDFALYLADDCATLGEPVRCNFFDNSEENRFTGVGEDPTGVVASIQYDDWLEVEPGQNYYLLINNFSSSNSGFSIQFSGDIFITNPNDALDCSIISNLLGAPIAACENEIITLDATTSNAMSYTWFIDTGNGYNEIPAETNATLVVDTDAFYRVVVDVSATESITSDVQVAFSEAPVAEPISDDVFCASVDGFYDLTEKDIEVLGAQDPNLYSVNYFITLTDAQMGINQLSNMYPMNLVGFQTIYARVNSLENPNCFDASQSFILEGIAPPTLGADEIIFLCEGEAAVTIGEETTNPDYIYSWSTGETTAAITVSEAGTYILTALTASTNNDFCRRTRTFEVVVSVFPEISDIIIEDFSFSNTITVVTDVEGDFEFSLDNENYQSEPTFTEVLPGNHTVYMRDVQGCGVVSEQIVVVGYLPYFSPNGDGIRDRWFIEGLENLDSPIVTIYSKQGKLLQQLNMNNQSWDGTFNGKRMPESDYWFRLSYLDDNGSRLEDRFLQKHFALRR